MSGPHVAKEFFDFKDDVSGRLADFCEALRGARKVRIVMEAVTEHIDRELDANLGVRKRYEALRARRRDNTGSKIRVVKGGNDV